VAFKAIFWHGICAKEWKKKSHKQRAVRVWSCRIWSPFHWLHSHSISFFFRSSLSLHPTLTHLISFIHHVWLRKLRQRRLHGAFFNLMDPPHGGKLLCAFHGIFRTGLDLKTDKFESRPLSYPVCNQPIKRLTGLCVICVFVGNRRPRSSRSWTRFAASSPLQTPRSWSTYVFLYQSRKHTTQRFSHSLAVSGRYDAGQDFWRSVLGSSVSNCCNLMALFLFFYILFFSIELRPFQQKINEKCFAKCVPKPGPKLDGSEQVSSYYFFIFFNFGECTTENNTPNHCSFFSLYLPPISSLYLPPISSTTNIYCLTGYPNLAHYALTLDPRS